MSRAMQCDHCGETAKMLRYTEDELDLPVGWVRTLQVPRTFSGAITQDFCSVTCTAAHYGATAKELVNG